MNLWGEAWWEKAADRGRSAPYRGRFSERPMTCQKPGYNFLAVPSPKLGLKQMAKAMTNVTW